MSWKLMLPFVGLLAGPAAHAEPWLCTQPDGNKAFSYEPESAKKKNCVHHPIPSANVWRVRPREPFASYDRPVSFPKVDARTQKHRDLARREILERELAEEKKSLAEAMKQLAEQQRVAAAAPGTVRTPPNGEDKLRPYRDKVRLHLTNIANLEKELERES